MELVTSNESVLGMNKHPHEHITAIGFSQGRHGYPAAKSLGSRSIDASCGLMSVSSPGATSPGEEMDFWEFLRQGG